MISIENILGLSDYLSTTALPNMHQMSQSDLIQVKKEQVTTMAQYTAQ